MCSSEIPLLSLASSRSKGSQSLTFLYIFRPWPAERAHAPEEGRLRGKQSGGRAQAEQHQYVLSIQGKEYLLMLVSFSLMWPSIVLQSPEAIA